MQLQMGNKDRQQRQVVETGSRDKWQEIQAAEKCRAVL